MLPQKHISDKKITEIPPNKPANNAEEDKKSVKLFLGGLTGDTNRSKSFIIFYLPLFFSNLQPISENILAGYAM